MTCGIYKLIFKGTDKVYIGQAIDIPSRYANHIQKMKSGNTSKKLLEAYNTYGIPTYEVLCECRQEELNSTENEAIELFDAVNTGFNTNTEADTCPILYGDAHGRSVYSNSQIEEVFELLITRFDLKHQEIANITGVSTNAISNISSGQTHLWLKQKYPKEYLLLNNRPKYHNSGKDRGITNPPVISPEGIVYIIDNVTRFAIEHGLQQGNLNAVLKGNRKTHKGWKLAIGESS